MNDAGRDALVQAYLKGIPQVRGMLESVDGGRCAMGVLIDAACGRGVEATFELSSEEWSEIVTMNDQLGYDFLTIARKAGLKETTL